ncbi:MAG: hypothetical protein LWX70_13045, partial [Sphingobacteriia bacterium]|nr:hypothetical protein [Sphingobacteriia bacterium]
MKGQNTPLPLLFRLQLCSGSDPVVERSRNHCILSIPYLLLYSLTFSISKASLLYLSYDSLMFSYVFLC